MSSRGRMHSTIKKLKILKAMLTQYCRVPSSTRAKSRRNSCSKISTATMNRRLVKILSSRFLPERRVGIWFFWMCARIETEHSFQTGFKDACSSG